MAFKYANIHVGYYLRVSKRADVVAHRAKFIPLLRTALTDPRLFYVNVDWSFFYENAFAKHAWIPLTIQNSDLNEAGKPGKGRRLSACEFILHSGILRHPDGNSAGTLFSANEIVDSTKVLNCIRRGCEAIAAHPAVSKYGLHPVLFIDGARTNTTNPPGFIDPSKMNLSDGGANRGPMNSIGVKGLRTVLVEQGRWSPHMTKAEAEEILWKSKMVKDQLTEIEKICKEKNIVCIYQSKAHPWLAPIEKWWRFSKSRLENSRSYEEMEQSYRDLISLSINNNVEITNKCEKWVNLSLKYAEYYARGGADIIREHEMKMFDLSTLPAPQARYRFHDINTLSEDAHKTNWILIRGKHFSGEGEDW